jgi:hypothetical protein
LEVVFKLEITKYFARLKFLGYLSSIDLRETKATWKNIEFSKKNIYKL